MNNFQRQDGDGDGLSFVHRVARHVQPGTIGELRLELGGDGTFVVNVKAPLPPFALMQAHHNTKGYLPNNQQRPQIVPERESPSNSAPSTERTPARLLDQQHDEEAEAPSVDVMTEVTPAGPGGLQGLLAFRPSRMARIRNNAAGGAGAGAGSVGAGGAGVPGTVGRPSNLRPFKRTCTISSPLPGLVAAGTGPGGVSSATSVAGWGDKALLALFRPAIDAACKEYAAAAAAAAEEPVARFWHLSRFNATQAATDAAAKTCMGCSDRFCTTLWRHRCGTCGIDFCWSCTTRSWTPRSLTNTCNSCARIKVASRDIRHTAQNSRSRSRSNRRRIDGPAAARAESDGASATSNISNDLDTDVAKAAAAAVVGRLSLAVEVDGTDGCADGAAIGADGAGAGAESNNAVGKSANTAEMLPTRHLYSWQANGGGGGNDGGSSNDGEPAAKSLAVLQARREEILAMDLGSSGSGGGGDGGGSGCRQLDTELQAEWVALITALDQQTRATLIKAGVTPTRRSTGCGKGRGNASPSTSACAVAAALMVDGKPSNVVTHLFLRRLACYEPGLVTHIWQLVMDQSPGRYGGYHPPTHPAPEVLRWSTTNARKQPVWSVAVLPGGQVATGGYDGAVRLLDRHNGDLATELYQHSADTKSWLHTTSLAVSPDGKEYIAAGSRDALVSVWANSNTNAGSGGDGDDGVIAASSGSSQPTGGGGSNERAATPPYTIAATPVIATLQGHTDVVWAVAWAPDGLQLASASDDGTVKVWCATEWKLIRTLVASRSAMNGGHRPGVHSVAYSEQGGLLASPGGPGGLCARLWQADTGASLRTLPGHASLVMCTVFNKEGTMLVTGAADCSIRLWQVPSGQALRALTAHASIVMCLAFSSDSRFLASGSADNTIMVWDLLEDRDCTTPKRAITGHRRHVMALAFTPENDLLSGSRDGTTRLWAM